VSNDEERFEPIAEARTEPAPVSIWQAMRWWLETIWRPGKQLRILGIEVVQAVQRFTITEPTLTDSGYSLIKPALNNSVPLVARKRTMVRVYVATSGGVGMGSLGVTGTLRVSPAGLVRGVAGPGGTVATWPPSPELIRPINENGAMMAAHPEYIKRDMLVWSLNFILPVDALTGRVRLQVEVHLQGTRALTFFPLARAATVVQFHERRLPSKLVPGLIHHPAAQGPATMGYYRSCLDQVIAMYPAPDADFTLHLVPGLEKIEIDSDLLTEAGWDEMFERLRRISTHLAEGYVLAALLPPTLVPRLVGSRYFSYELAHEGQSWVGDPAVFLDADGFAHELGHRFGLNHAAQGNPKKQDEDTRIPFETTDELGLDLSKRLLMPKGSWEMMYYLNEHPKWISTYTWQALFDQFAP